MKKKLISLGLAFVVAMTLVVPALAAEPAEDVVYIDASQVSEEELDAIVEKASNEQRIIVIQYEGGRVDRLSPASKRTPRIYASVTKTLSTTSWTEIGKCNPIPIIGSNLVIEMGHNNPGSAKIKIVDDETKEEHVTAAIKPGYDLETRWEGPYTLYAQAESVPGSYYIFACDWITMGG